jgi:pilus assembly protein CpaC
MIVVTPYIVKPVDANRIALPTDGYRSAKPADRILDDKQTDGQSGMDRPKPSAAPAATPAAAPANS